MSDYERTSDPKIQDDKGFQITCPVCRKASLFSSQNQYRPFCSQRCKEQDLSGWASETYKIPCSAAHLSDDEEGENDAGL